MEEVLDESLEFVWNRIQRLEERVKRLQRKELESVFVLLPTFIR